MSSKDSPLKRRLRNIERELGAVDREARTLVKTIERGEARPAPPSPRYPRPDPHSGDLFATSFQPAGTKTENDEQLSAQERGKLERNQRFANYFISGSVDGIRPLRGERRIQRNKAIAMVLFVAIILFAVLYWIARTH